MTLGEKSGVPSINVVGNRCCGCGACAASCPVSCLIMEPDSLGFVHPIDTGCCVSCGKCAKVCPVLTIGKEDQVISAFWAKAKDNKLRNHSSSGAVFGLLARDVLGKAGAVYGAAFSEGCRRVKHIRISSEDKLDAVLRSKYVQSSVGFDVYKGVENDLKEGRRVLFTGTACQNVGLYNYLSSEKVPMDNLLLVEIFCHGVPSPKLWSKWLDYTSYNVRAKIDGVNFRSKSTGWTTYSVVYYAGMEKAKSEVGSHDWYMKAFLQNASLRESCFNCPSKRSCGSDLTLGDFWGIQDIHPEVVDSLGVSAVICNTKKGVTAFQSICNYLNAGPVALEDIVRTNPSLVHSAKPYIKRDSFLTDIANDVAIENLIHKWDFKPSWNQRVRNKLLELKRRFE